MKRLLLTVGFTALLLASGAIAQSHPDLSGTWEFDPLRSRFDKIPVPASATMRIEHQEPKIRIVMTATGRSGPVEYTLELTTDGAPAKQTVAGQPCVATAEWGARSGERLTVEMHCDGPSGSTTTSRQLKMDSGRKMLTTILTMGSGTGQKKAYEFFVRR